jgi:hypothetical protein
VDKPGAALMPWSLQEQVHPDDLNLWNHLADNPEDHQALTNVTQLLREDFPAFCALLLKVRPKGGGYVVPFLFNQVQQRIWREMSRCIREGKPLWFVILKFRQAGMSTFWCAWIFWQMWRQRDIQTMIVAHQLPTAETMIETQRVFFDELPDIFKPDLRDGNHGSTIPRGEVYFADRRAFCLIHLAKNADPRGQQVTHVLETEFAMYQNPDEMNAALIPQLPQIGSDARKTSSFIIESTPKGQNEFFDYYDAASKGKKGDFIAIFCPWFLFDEQYSAEPPPNWRMTAEEKALQQRLTRMRMNDYAPEDGGGKPVTRAQMYFRRSTIESTFGDDADKFDQEYPSDPITCWLLSSKSVFREYSQYLLDSTIESVEYAKNIWLKQMVGGKPVVTRGPLFVKLLPKIVTRGEFIQIQGVGFEQNPHGYWRIWAPPISGHKYSIGADPSLGFEDGDCSCICVIDVTEARQVAEFVGFLSPEKFAVEACAAGYWYNQALVVPEINGIGFVTLTTMLGKIGYPNMYRWPKWDEVNKYSHKRGFETNNRTKQLMVSAMITYFDDRRLQIASKELLAELSTFEQQDDGSEFMKFGAQKGRHDDRVMALGLALMGVAQTPQLALEIDRARGPIPSAREMHLSSAVAVAPVVELPKAIKEMQTMKAAGSWSCFGSDPF